MGKKVLIFGIGGFVGRYLAQEFKSNGYIVYGSDIHAPSNYIENTKFVKADLMNAELVLQVICEIKPDMIINLAAISSVGVSWNVSVK